MTFMRLESPFPACAFYLRNSRSVSNELNLCIRDTRPWRELLDELTRIGPGHTRQVLLEATPEIYVRRIFPPGPAFVELRKMRLTYSANGQTTPDPAERQARIYLDAASTAQFHEALRLIDTGVDDISFTGILPERGAITFWSSQKYADEPTT